MSARAPLDVDLEDKLVYGLTPTRLAYLVVSLLAAFSTWTSAPAPVPVRMSAAAFIVVFGAAAAWGRWRGRATDIWVVYIALFVVANYRVEWTLRLKLPHRRPRVTVTTESSAEPLATAA